MKHVLSTLALGASMVFAATCGQAANTTFRATQSGPSEAIPNASPGFSIAEVDVDLTAMSLSVREPFQDLESPTTVSHIHCCTPTPFTGEVAPATTLPSFPGFPVGVMSGLYQRTFNLRDPASFNPAFVSANGGTPESAAAALVAGINANEAYLNIHTNLHPNGEIRGFIVPIPEPESWAMLGLGLAGIAFMARRRT